MQTCPCNVYPLTPQFYIENTGVYRGVHYFHIFVIKHIYCGYSLEPPIYVLSKNMKIVKQFQQKIVILTAVKNRCILHERVLVMSVLESTALLKSEITVCFLWLSLTVHSGSLIKIRFSKQICLVHSLSFLRIFSYLFSQMQNADFLMMRLK